MKYTLAIAALACLALTSQSHAATSDCLEQPSCSATTGAMPQLAATDPAKPDAKANPAKKTAAKKVVKKKANKPMRTAAPKAMPPSAAPAPAPMPAMKSSSMVDRVLDPIGRFLDRGLHDFLCFPSGGPGAQKRPACS